ncbi:MAG: hypothetical protein FWF08_07260, partial [Oscillospiraceae bacterium]|nr:hypothetical protein [Oscillospiraceae bacterium]
MYKKPLILENFDNARSCEQGTGRRWAAFSEKTYTSADIITKSERPDIIRGRNALRVDYDFRFETTRGGSRRSYCHTYSTAENHLSLGTELADNPDTLVVPEGDYPTHLGIWLYGNGSDAWINGGIVDSNGAVEDIAYGDQNWTGWRFVTGAIPPGLKLPLYVSYPLRLLSGSHAIHGTVWLGSVMALYGGIDFDAIPPEIENIEYNADGRVTAYIYDPDDEENKCPASGIDISRAEIYIDGARHGKNISFAPDGRGFALSCGPDFPLCDGYHKATIVAYDKEGNAGQKSAFFRQNQGVSWSMPREVYLGNSWDIKISGIDTGYGEMYIEWDCDDIIKSYNEPFYLFKTDESGTETTLPVTTVDFGMLSGPATAGFRCVSAHYKKGDETFAFCLPDLKTELTAGLNLVMRRFSKGFDAQFVVSDLQNRPVSDAYIRLNGKYLDENTDENGILTVPGLTDGELGQKIEASAAYRNDCSYLK